MTDLQNKYWTLQESIRANRAQEGLKQFSNLSERMRTVSQIEVNDADIAKISADIERTAAEIQKIKSDTSLNDVKKQELISQTVKNYSDSVSGMLKGIFGKGGVWGAGTGLASGLIKAAALV